MDAKALAKLKRAHSQRHSKKYHPSHASKALPTVASTSAENADKLPGKKVREKNRQSSLPSNWDRYGEESNSGSEDPTLDSRNQSTDVIVPKSKGADYGHLISEAQAQLQSQSIPDSGIFPSFDDALPDFHQGVSSMLSVRGKGILSWAGDNNFIVEDTDTLSYEASFLSMDLHALAEQLAKVDLPQRLFIEADLLPTDLWAEGSNKRNNQEFELAETTHESNAAKQILDELEVTGHADGGIIFDPEGNITSSRTFDNELRLRMVQGTRQADQVEDGSRHFEQTDSSIIESLAELKVTSAVDSRTRFEVAAAEAELDVLLESLGGTKFSDLSGSTQNPCNKYPVSPQPSNQGRSSSKNMPMFTNLDDAVDDLIQETSDTGNQPDIAQPQEKDFQLCLPSASGPNPKLLDDFDSWLDTI